MTAHRIYKVLRNINMFLSHHKRVFHIFKGFNTPSYFLNKNKNKPKISQVLDYLYMFFLLKIMPSNYHLFGFDTKTRKEFKSYIGCGDSDPYAIKKLNVLWRGKTILVHDKHIFKILCEYHCLPVPRHYGILKDGVLSGQHVDLQHLMKENSLKCIVLKPKTGAWGVSIHLISVAELNNPESSTEWKEGEYIVEECIKQHSKLDEINPHSINSIRIITFLCTNGDVELIGAMLRTSSSTFHVDNFTLGGVVVGIDLNNGRLKKEGFVCFLSQLNFKEFKSSLGIKSISKSIEDMRNKGLLSPGKIFLRHPVSQTKFLNFQLPYWDDLKKMVIKGQKEFNHMKSIGWDIAVTPEGPVIIEANQTWGTVGMQATNRGLLTEKNRRLFNQYGIFFPE